MMTPFLLRLGLAVGIILGCFSRVVLAQNSASSPAILVNGVTSTAYPIDPKNQQYLYFKYTISGPVATTAVSFVASDGLLGNEMFFVSRLPRCDARPRLGE